MYINVVVFLQENDDVDGCAADCMSLLLLHFHIKDAWGTVRIASLKDAIWLGPSVAHVHQRRRSLQENDDGVMKNP